MRSEHRLKRLRELLDQLGQLPPTAERERMLREVRARVVDVDTGVTPSPLKPVLAEEARAPAEPRQPARRAPRAIAPASVDVRAQLRATRLREPAKHAQAAPAAADDRLTFATDELLCLGDPAALEPGDARPERAGAWTRGLRG